MIHRLGRRKYKIYAFDIETHNDDETIQKGETSMWLGCLIDENSKIDEESSYLYNMDTFIHRLDELSSPKKRKSHDSPKECKNVCVYIYNLSFEWSFILPVLLSKGFKAVEKVNDNSEMEFSSVTTKSVSSVWDVTIKFSPKHGKIVLRDLAKIYGGGLGNVAKSFNLETQKGSIDYRLNRLHMKDENGNEIPWIPTKEEKEYCFKDTRIIIEILLKLVDDKEFWNVSSIASYSMKHLLAAGFKNTYKPYKEFRKLYPSLGEEETNFLRKGVEGGITYATPKFQFKVINQKIYHIDIHQAHPHSGWKYLFPYGEGEYFTGKPPRGKISACRIRITYNGVYLHSIIKLIGIDYITNFEIVVWDFEIPVMMKCYKDLKIKFIDGYAYKMRFLPWRNYYAKNYSDRLDAKKKGDAFNTLRYKLLNNSSYGKLLEKPHNEVLLNCINDLGIVDSIVSQKPQNEQKINAKYTYLPVGSSIPARTRCYLVSTALLFGWEKILYFDTDSIFILWDEEVEKIWNSDQINKEDWLGGWALEEVLEKAQFTAPKRYKTQKIDTHSVDIKAGGINFDKYFEEHHMTQNDVPFDEINITDETYQVQRAMRCKGGTIIIFQDKKMTIQKKYKNIFDKNTNKN